MRSSDVDSVTRASVEAHLAGCADCKARLAPAAMALPASAAVKAVLFPDEIAGVPRGWVYTVVSLGSATLALAIVVVYLLGRPATAHERGERAEEARRPSATAQEPAAPEAQRPEPKPAAALEPTAPTPAEEAVSPTPAAAPAAPAERSAARAASPQSPQASSSAPKARTREEASTATSAPGAAPPAPEPGAVVAAAAPPPAPEAAAEASKPKDEIEALLVEAAGNNTAPPPVKEEKSDNEPTGLTRAQVFEVMNSLQDKVHECAVQTGKSGTVQVTATVVPTGRVKSVRVAGMFAGTPTGDCVASAIRGAVFPTFVGQPQPVNYPVPLR